MVVRQLPAYVVSAGGQRPVPRHPVLGAEQVVEVTSMGDLGLEVGGALGDAEIAAAISGGFSCMPLGLDSHMPGSFVPGNMAFVP